MQVGETLLVLLGDGQQGAHIPDLMIDVVPPGFGRSFGGSVRDHVFTEVRKLSKLKPKFCLLAFLKKICLR